MVGLASLMSRWIASKTRRRRPWGAQGAIGRSFPEFRLPERVAGLRKRTQDSEGDRGFGFLTDVLQFR